MLTRLATVKSIYPSAIALILGSHVTDCDWLHTLYWVSGKYAKWHEIGKRRKACIASKAGAVFFSISWQYVELPFTAFPDIIPVNRNFLQPFEYSQFSHFPQLWKPIKKNWLISRSWYLAHIFIYTMFINMQKIGHCLSSRKKLWAAKIRLFAIYEWKIVNFNRLCKISAIMEITFYGIIL